MTTFFNEEFLFFFFSAGIINGIVLAVLLLSQKKTSLSNKFLGGLILLFSVELILISFFDSSFQVDVMAGVPIPLILMSLINFMFLYGVLFYLYVRAVIFDLKGFSGKTLLHFGPLVLFVLMGVGNYVLNGLGENTEMFYQVMFFQNLSQNIVGVVYLLLSLKQLNLYKTRSRDRHSNPDRINLSWLTLITVMQIVLWVISIVGLILIIFAGSRGTAVLEELFYLVLTAVILFAGYYALRHPAVFNIDYPETSPVADAAGDEVSEGDTSVTEPEENENAHHPAMYRQLLEIMDSEKPFIDADLTIDRLSSIVNIPVYLLSRLINEQSGQNFFNFVNRFRVEEVKQQLKDPRNRKTNLLSIALGCGFSSKTTFNTIFKKLTGRTPSQFRQSVTQKTQV